METISRALFNDDKQSFIDFSRFTFAAPPARGRAASLPASVDAYITFNRDKGRGTKPVLMVRQRVIRQLRDMYPATESGGVERVRIGFDPHAREFAVIAVGPGGKDGVKIQDGERKQNMLGRIAIPSSIQPIVRSAFNEQRTDLGVRVFDGGIMFKALEVLE